MMNKEAIDELATKRPFEPFEIRLVDGRRFRFTRVDQFVVGRNVIVTMDRRGNPVIISMGLITTAGRPGSRRRAGNG